jgi:hypothetical protein
MHRILAGYLLLGLTMASPRAGAAEAIMEVYADVAPAIEADIVELPSSGWRLRSMMYVSQGPQLTLRSNLPYLVRVQACLSLPVEDPSRAEATRTGLAAIRLLRTLRNEVQRELPTSSQGRDYATEILQGVEQGAALLGGARDWGFQITFVVSATSV